MNDPITFYAKKRDKALYQQRKNHAIACKASDELSRLMQEYATLQIDFLTATNKHAPASLATITQSLQENQERKQSELLRVGLPADFLDLHYDCPQCKDYGFIDGQPCTCYHDQFDLSSDATTIDAFDNQTFDTFDETIFPTKNNQQHQMISLRNYAQKYAMNFPNNQPRNLFLLGPCGIGKTFLLNCIGERVLQRGFSVEKVTASRFQQIIFNDIIKDGNQRSFNRLLNAQLLIFDDLGAESAIGGATTIIAQHLYTLIDERMSTKRAGAISTNLSAPELQEKYGTRVFSRLLDTQSTYSIGLDGQDVRLLPRS